MLLREGLRQEPTSTKIPTNRLRLLAEILACCILIVIFPDRVPAQQTLSLDEAIRLALVQSPLLLASKAAENIAAEHITQARAAYLPELNYSESLQWGNNPVYVFSALLQQHRFTTANFDIATLNRPDPLTNFTSQVTLSQNLFDGNKTRHRVETAQGGKEMANEQSRQSTIDVLLSVAESYYGAVLAAEDQRVAISAVRAAQSDLDRAQSMQAAGMTTDADMLAIRVHMAEMHDQQIRAQNNLEIALARLNDVLSVPLQTRYTLTTPMQPYASPAATLEEYENRAFEYRPESKQAAVAVRLAEADYKLSRAALLPELTIHAAFEANRQTFATRGGGDWITGATLHLNFFRGFGDRSRISESSFLKRQKDQQSRSIHSALQLQVYQSFLDLNSANARVTTSESAVAEAEEVYRIVTNRYESGLSTVTELLRSETALNSARLRYLGAAFDQRIAAVRLERAAGTLNVSSDVFKP